MGVYSLPLTPKPTGGEDGNDSAVAWGLITEWSNNYHLVSTYFVSMILHVKLQYWI